MNLDDAKAIARFDSEDMLGHISELPQQCRNAWEQAREIEIPSGYGNIDHLVIVGMGGSAIGGALLQDLASDQCDVSTTVIRGYELPAFVSGQDALVVACSYSGNTEETLSCFQEALDREARVVAITTGGKLAGLAREANAPLVQFGYQSQPRAALGYSFVLLLGMVHRLGLIQGYARDIAAAAEVMEEWREETRAGVPSAENPAKQLAEALSGKLPVVYGAGFLAATANRWKTQFNENAKSWAFFEQLPELNHNSVVGLGMPDVVREHSVVVMLRSSLESRRLRERWDVTAQVLEREGVTSTEVWGRGQSKLAQMLSLIQFGDYVSFYAAMLNEVDPTPVETIAFLKARLAELGNTVN